MTHYRARERSGDQRESRKMELSDEREMLPLISSHMLCLDCDYELWHICRLHAACSLDL